MGVKTDRVTGGSGVTRRELLGAAVAGLAAPFLGLTGCGPEDGGREAAAPLNLAIVIGNHSNSLGFDLQGAGVVRDALVEAASGPGSLHVVVCDGDPFVASSSLSFGSQAKNGRRRSAENEVLASEALAAISAAAAVSPEVDTYAAINLARRALSGLGGRRLILVLDTGLPTKGVVNAGDNILEVDPGAYVDALASQGSLVDLSGCEVTWLYLGDVAAPQEDLTEASIDNLREVWASVLDACGASPVEFSDIPAGSQPVSGLPAVSTVDVPDPGPVAVPEPVVLDDGTVSFVPDTAEFADPAAAREGISAAARWLAENPGGRVTVVGHTASIPGFDEEGVTLSRERAESVAAVLVELGVEPSRIDVLGVGDSDQVVDDLDENGAQIEGLAQQNRRVVLSFSI